MTVTSPLAAVSDDTAAEPADEWHPSGHVSYSSLDLHRRCPQAWAYRYLARLQRPEALPSVPRQFGTWWHALRAVDAYHTGAARGTLRYAPRAIQAADSVALPIDSTVADVIDAAARWWGRLSPEATEAWAEDIGPLPDRLRQMNARWAERWSEELQHEDPLAVEMPFERRLPGTDAVVPGRIDLIVHDRRRSLIVCRDIKSNGTIPTMEATQNLMDSQLHLYGWAATPVIRTQWERGETIAVSYDRARSKPPKQPKVTASGGLSKGVTDYDLATYLAWAQGPDGQGVPWGQEGEYYKTGKRSGEPKFGRYTAEEKEIERLSTPTAQAVWFDRTPASPLNRNIIRAHLQAAVDTQRAAVGTEARWRETGEGARNLGKHCTWCDFRDLCLAQMIGGPDGDYDPAQYGLTSSR